MGRRSVNKRRTYPCSGQIRGKETSRVMDRGGAPSALLFPAPPCHLGIINSCGAGGQIRAISHVGRLIRHRRSLSPSMTFVFHSASDRGRRSQPVSSHQWAPLRTPPSTPHPSPLPLAESVPPLDTDGAQVTDGAPMHSGGAGGGPKPLHHRIEERSCGRGSERRTEELSETQSDAHGRCCAWRRMVFTPR